MNVTTEQTGSVSVVRVQETRIMYPILGEFAAGGCLVPIPDDHRGAVLEAFAARARRPTSVTPRARRAGARA